MYQIKHSHIYNLLKSQQGHAQLVAIVTSICKLLQLIANIGALYGNLRIENILVKLSRNLQSIEQVKFINLGYLT